MSQPLPWGRHPFMAVTEQDSQLQEVTQDTAIPVPFGGENGFSLLMPAYLFVVQGPNPNCGKHLTMTVA